MLLKQIIAFSITNHILAYLYFAPFRWWNWPLPRPRGYLILNSSHKRGSEFRSKLKWRKRKKERKWWWWGERFPERKSIATFFLTLIYYLHLDFKADVPSAEWGAMFQNLFRFFKEIRCISSVKITVLYTSHLCTHWIVFRGVYLGSVSQHKFFEKALHYAKHRDVATRI